jgi:hypothetical protein
MADDPGLTASCPWCSESLPAPDAAECPSCGAHLVGDDAVGEVPGVTAIDPALARVAAAPRRVKRTFGSLLVSDDDEIPPPTQAEMPALARPDADVRREMLRLELEARLAALQADARMLEAEGRPTTVEIDPGLVEAALGEPPEVSPADEPIVEPTVAPADEPTSEHYAQSPSEDAER